ncbi:MAG: hypothetical protein ACKOC9_03645, partial [Alphaproteobacteria bacterium]
MTDRPRREDPIADNPGGADAEGKRSPRARTARPRDAASLIVWRQSRKGPELLMGKRHAGHRFMPDVMVFPGGRVDPDDHRGPAISELRGDAMIIRVNAPTGKHHHIRHEAMPGMALAHQQFRAFAALAPDNQAGGITWARGA